MPGPLRSGPEVTGTSSSICLVCIPLRTLWDVGFCQRCPSPCEEPKVRAQTPGPEKEEKEEDGGEMAKEGEEDGVEGKSSQRRDRCRWKGGYRNIEQEIN